MRYLAIASLLGISAAALALGLGRILALGRPVVTPLDRLRAVAVARMVELDAEARSGPVDEDGRRRRAIGRGR